MRHFWSVGLVIVFVVYSSAASQGQDRKSCLNSSNLWISADLMMKPGQYFSPDGRYYVRVNRGISLRFSHLNLHPTLNYTELLGAVDPGAINGLVWLPGKPHTLVFATRSGDPGHSMLALWNGGRRVRMLHRVISDQDDEFKLFAVSRDGKSVVYGWRGWTGNKFVPKVIHKRHLHLSAK